MAALTFGMRKGCDGHIPRFHYSDKSNDIIPTELILFRRCGIILPDRFTDRVAYYTHSMRTM